MGQANDNAILGGGYNAPAGTVIANTESWNGSSWTELADLATARSNAGSGGGSASGIVMVGYLAPGSSAATEEWDNAGATKTLTVS